MEATMEKTEKRSVKKMIDNHPRMVFWARLVSWASFACFIPFAFIVWRFKLFQKISSIQIGGWGIIGIILVAVFVITVIRYVRLALSVKYTLIGQILGGFSKAIVPLLAALCMLKAIKDNIDLMMQVLGCITICEAIAIPLNPLPKWVYDCQKNVRVEERKNTIDYLLNGLATRGNKEGEK